MKVSLIVYHLCIVLLIGCAEKGSHDSTINKENTLAQISFFKNKIKDITSTTPADSVVFYFSALSRLYKNSGDIIKWASFQNEAYNFIYDSLGTATLAGQFLDTVIANSHLLKDTVSEKELMNGLFYRGYDVYSMGEYPRSISLLEKYILLRTKYPHESKTRLASAYSLLGNTLIMQGDNVKGASLLLRSFELYKTIGDTEGLRSICVNIANVYNQTGNYTKAIAYADTGLSTPLKEDTSRTAYLLADKAESYTGLGLYKQALQDATEGLRILHSIKDTDWEKVAELEAVIANSMSYIDKTSAIRYYKNSLYSSQQAFDNIRRREVGKKMANLGKCYEEINQPDSAIYYYHHALYTVVNVDTNDIFSLPSKSELYAENTIMETLDAKAAWMTGYFTQKEKYKYWQCAVNCYDLAFEVERKLLLNFSYDESKISMLKESRQRSERAITLCYKLFRDTKDNQWIEKAFRFAERNKAFIVLESIKRNLAALQTVQSDTFFQKVQRLQLEYAYAEKSLLEAKNNNDTAQLNQLEEGKSNADEQLQLARTSLYQNNSSYRQWMEKEDSLSIAMAQNLLPGKQSALIEYFVGDSVSYAIIAGSNKKYGFVSINNDQLGLIDSVQYFFRDKNAIVNNPARYQQNAHAVYINWVKPCLDSFDVTKLLIIPDATLSILPFDALITDISTGNNLQSWAYMAKKYQVELGYSVSTLLKQNERQSNQAGIVAFAPGFINKERNLAALPFTFEEVDNIKSENSTVLYKNKDAILSQFRRSAAGSGVIHIASHAGTIGAEGIPSIEFADSTLLVNELYAMRVNADLVVLSACQTGIGKIEKSEGPMSLARGFYYAGAKNIITSLWNINDRATAALFKDFYQNAGSGKYSYALYTAKKDYLSASLANDKYSPYYWAGFICIGQDSKKKKNDQWYWWAEAALLLTLLLIWKYKNKKRPGKP